MKRLLLVFTLMFALQKVAMAQGIGVFPGSPGQSINFVAISNAPLDYLPAGTESYCSLVFPGQSPANVLNVYVDVGSTPNADGWILQKENDGSLTPLFQLAIQPDYSGTIGVYPGMPPSSYADVANVQLTDAQVQNFFAGQLYVQADFETGSYLGQLTPAPEPTSLELIFCGVGLLVFLSFKNRLSSSTP